MSFYSSGEAQQDNEYCKFYINSNEGNTFYLIDSRGTTNEPESTGFLAPTICCATPEFGTQAFADHISSAWSTEENNPPQLLRLYSTKSSAAVDFIEGDRVWSIKIHNMRDFDIEMWRAFMVVMCHSPRVNTGVPLTHLEKIILVSHIPAIAVAEDVTGSLEE